MFNISFRKSCRLWDNVEKYRRTRQATDDTVMWRMRIECWMIMATDTLWNIQGAYKLSEDFAKSYFHKY